MKTPESFFAVDDEGNLIKCETLFAFDSEVSGSKRSYIVYTDNTIDEEGATHVFASYFDENQAPVFSEEHVSLGLHPIESQKEWVIVEETLDWLANHRS